MMTRFKCEDGITMTMMRFKRYLTICITNNWRKKCLVNFDAPKTKLFSHFFNHLFFCLPSTCLMITATRTTHYAMSITCSLFTLTWNEYIETAVK